MTTRKDDDESLDVDGFDDGNVMRKRDGVLHLGMRMMDSMDSVQRAVAASTPPVADAMALHRPGHRLPAANTDATRQMEVNDALRETRKAMLEDAWQLGEPATAITGGRDAYIARTVAAWRAPA